MYDQIKQTFLKYWFIVSSLAITALFILFDRRGRQINEIKMDTERAMLALKLSEIQSRSIKSGEEYEKAVKEYNDLRARHSDLLRKYNFAPGNTSERNDH